MPNTLSPDTPYPPFGDLRWSGDDENIKLRDALIKAYPLSSSQDHVSYVAIEDGDGEGGVHRVAQLTKPFATCIAESLTEARERAHLRSRDDCAGGVGMKNPLTFDGNNDLRRVRANVLAGNPIPADVYARLIAAGVDVGALENRLIQAQEFRT